MHRRSCDYFTFTTGKVVLIISAVILYTFKGDSHLVHINTVTYMVKKNQIMSQKLKESLIMPLFKSLE